MTPGVGPRRFQSFVDAFGSPTAFWSASRTDWLAAGVPQPLIEHLQARPEAAVERTLRWAESAHNHVLCCDEADYPSLLHELNDKPPILFVCGHLACLRAPQIAIVGTRNASDYGRRQGTIFSTGLARAGLVITSGLAKGIDTVAHRGALAAGGQTIAVMGTGLDRVYPAENRELAHQIAQNGALISEFPLGTEVRSTHFPRRNRLISGMSVGVLVVEAALKSGSLISARLAMEQNREVFAIPGLIDQEGSRGCHSLIRQGAKLVETLEDVLEELGPLAYVVQQAEAKPVDKPPNPSATYSLPDDLAEDHQNLCKCLEKNPLSAEELAISLGLTIPEVSSMLLILELRGVVVAQPGGLYARHDAGNDL